jgi:hypothetical protein
MENPGYQTTHYVETPKDEEEEKTVIKCPMCNTVLLHHKNCPASFLIIKCYEKRVLCNKIQDYTLQAFANQHYALIYSTSRILSHHDIKGKLSHLDNSCYRAQLILKGIIYA